MAAVPPPQTRYRYEPRVWYTNTSHRNRGILFTVRRGIHRQREKYNRRVIF